MEITRQSVKVFGIVQGVGFRPFVYNLAVGFGLAGFVRNTSGNVEIEVEGDRASVDAFLVTLRTNAPPLSTIENIESMELDPALDDYTGFSIEHSTHYPDAVQSVPPDAATCGDCLAELFDPGNRRYRYPFTNCTNCGPRFTIITALPYDRPFTTMAGFVMCEMCQHEYDNPGDRRFHAQPNACSACGPTLAFRETARSPSTFGEEALSLTVRLIREGGIAAVKGLGGFHLICAAESDGAVTRLRGRKGRYDKPLAVMMPDLETVARHCLLTEPEERLLSGRERPIVLLQLREDSQLAPSVAPGLGRLGVMLPYTPLHHLLLRDLNMPVVATSGNLSEEPISIANDDATARLADIADGFLLHNRDIESRYDDSVVRMIGPTATHMRRSRGFAPQPLSLPCRSEASALGVGAHLKNTFCIIDGDRAFLSQHVGDLDNLETLEHFDETLSRFLRLFSLKPDMVVHDLHPDYVSTTRARELAHEWGVEVRAVQHHHAHIVAAMVDNRIDGEVIGLAFDGLGLGTDGALWGGEFLVCDHTTFRRAASLATVPMPGAAAAIKNPWRMALGYAFDARADRGGPLAEYARRISVERGESLVELVRAQVESSLNSPLTSSLGRLFDAVAALLEVRSEARYEGQAAMELEALAERGRDDGDARSYEWRAFREDGLVRIDQVGLLETIYADYLDGAPGDVVARRFHRTLVEIALDTCLKIGATEGIDRVCLSGGVFQNALIGSWLVGRLQEHNFEVFCHRQVPTNDGGISLGQATIGLSQAGALR